MRDSIVLTVLAIVGMATTARADQNGYPIYGGTPNYVTGDSGTAGCLTCQNIWDGYCESKHRCIGDHLAHLRGKLGGHCGQRCGGCGVAGGVGLYGYGMQPCCDTGCGNVRHSHGHSHLLGKLFPKKNGQASCCTGEATAGDCAGGCDTNGFTSDYYSNGGTGKSDTYPDIKLPDEPGPALDPLPAEPVVPPAPPSQPAEIDSDSGASAAHWLHPQLRRLFRK